MFIWQTKKWQEMLKKSKQVSNFIEVNITEKEKIYIEKRKIGFGQYGLFILGLEKKLINKVVIEKLKNIVNNENSLFLQIEFVDYKNGIIETNINYLFNNKFSKGYYKKFITPYTAIIDLTQTQEDILKNMKPKGRYNIKLAQKKGVSVEFVDKTDKNIGIFYNLMCETTSRDGFYGNTLSYYKIFLNTLENSKLIFAKKDGIVIASGIFIFNKDISIYYYGASSSDKNYRNLMAPYLVQWHAIKYAKSIGSNIYDFLGVASPNDLKSSLIGVTNFKKKFTKDIINVSESYIYINNKIFYFVFSLLRKLKNKLKSFKYFAR